ncbi:hypothetical protein LTR10_021716 [Elasticomyces elasticus]|uniref:SsuA/THI5-like domain-containing protein n=1 Tax=Exophiala sideris TaxID=1016849 RepID=A0ABR0JEA9_9EURO|nr:hypothetical protein LTR10_021716 [Elasticomyces elasticus]KAK5032534.1 hypothetical protein LTS07_003942 [Exophiala sideris]KAK5037288.1 hypothetical protein LTR13_005094 [Exophiala sideris]KAK5062058.1 hypothetical protein LTR69_004415 [Exophiala sideris]KAK5182446.1 hypothetical protein LTR44_005458 [Eurotiomycetes sp. CCFEE 6388]
MIAKAVANMESLNLDEHGEPTLSRPYTLKFVGDWGGANFHRICSWLTQEFCDRAGPGSRTSIWSLRDGGLDSLMQLNDGDADLAICTPAALMSKLPSGGMPFPKPMPHLRALGTLPQNDRLVLAVDPKYNIKTFEELRRQKPALRMSVSMNDGTNFIGYVANEFLNAHGIIKKTVESWGGSLLMAHRPEQCVALVESRKADALLQEAIMTPWWRRLIEANQLVPLPAEPEALKDLEKFLGMRTNVLPAGFWDNLTEDLPALDFSDFVIFVRDDMPKEVAYLLTWCLVETRHMLEGQYKHLPPEKSPLTYPLDPEKMAQTPIALHDGAKEYYSNRDVSGQQGTKSTVSPF